MPSEDTTQLDPNADRPRPPTPPRTPIEALARAPELEDYKLEGEIARGGQGAVYLARHRQGGGSVAVKLLLDEDERSTARVRFAREAAVLGRLRHPHLPQVLGHGTCAAGAFMVMEFIRGPDLRRLVERNGVPDFAWTRRTLAVIARALQAVHDQGLIHRDVKPANILIEKTEGRPDLARGGEHVPERPILVDFGLAKQVGAAGGTAPGRTGSPWTAWEGLTEEGHALGTPAFMAPEQAGEEVGPWTDVYGLGTVLYFLLTGRPPFQGVGLEVLVHVVLGDVVRPRAVNPAVPADLEELCLRAMRVDHRQRPQSAQELADELAGE